MGRWKKSLAKKTRVKRRTRMRKAMRMTNSTRLMTCSIISYGMSR